jgi:hypothetical protein
MLITIGEKLFKTKGAAAEFIREILYRYEIGVNLTGDDHYFIYDLLLLHPERDDKIGAGVEGFSVSRDGRFGTTKHFSINRIDGTSVDFSFAKCLSSNANDPIKLFNAAARASVASQIILFKKIFLKSIRTIAAM